MHGAFDLHSPLGFSFGVARVAEIHYYVYYGF